MNKKERINLIRELESELAYGRFVHTLNVASTAASLAMCYGFDVDKAETAGLLHDCAKCMNLGKMLKICEKAGLELSEIEKGSGSLLHSKAGAELAQSKYGVKDEDILNAIRYHTTGRPGMSLLEKIIFTADYIEPGRDSAPNLPVVRKLAFESIDDCVLQILRDTLSYLGTTGAEVDPMTQKTYEYYRRCDEERKFYEVIDISEVSVLADYFIIANGSSRPQIQALSDEVSEKMEKAGAVLKQVEGYEHAKWILLDFGDVIVHIFNQEDRLLYDLERIWRDGKQIDPDHL